jgi:hypothetical protein
MDSRKFLICLTAFIWVIFFIITPNTCLGQTLPISYYYTNPLFYSNYGYINSITDPFYYLGYGYQNPILGNDLLGAYTFTPFLNPYEVYLYDYFQIDTFPYLSYSQQIAFPYETLPGAIIPYTNPYIPTYTYGLIDNYLSWLTLQ